MADTTATAARSSLDGILLLQPLTKDQRADVARRCSWKTFQEGEQVIDQTSDSRDVCFVVEGTLRVVNHSLSGREISFDDIPAGAFLGELAALDGGPRSASVVARKSDTLIAFLSPKAFQELVTGHPELAVAVMKRLCAVVRASNDRIMDLSTLAANNRVQAEVLRLALMHRKPDGTAAISPIPVHSDIASRVSTTRETVARVLSDLTRDGMLKKSSTTLIVTDVDGLQEMVEDVKGAV